MQVQSHQEWTRMQILFWKRLIEENLRAMGRKVRKATIQTVLQLGLLHLQIRLMQIQMMRMLLNFTRS